ncbi:hypothetical protein HELRODRAFT_89334 [Helobdella robusta]|uniref:Calmodulin-binding transcription activator 1 n=1 Tax=Helobdella robusta TaxID=6412 RepID=T1G7C1_HELRO|nr:hypothetical protein HELRODRAFT_89334 [Helobdella robusta]ESN92453.1 hypothetical protein HELRODRAFT_89334 [Helobdella robusta]
MSPSSSVCLTSPYGGGGGSNCGSYTSDSSPTTTEFSEFFNAPATYMEKDFSLLTLSDDEQKKLYEAAKIVQDCYRKYKGLSTHQLKQRQEEINAAILIQNCFRRYKQFMFHKRMTQAAVLIQSQFRSYYAQKKFKRSREAATIIQSKYRAYKQHERYMKSKHAVVIIQQRFRFVRLVRSFGSFVWFVRSFGSFVLLVCVMVDLLIEWGRW